MTFLTKIQFFTRINQLKVIFTFSFLFIFNLLGLTQNSSLCYVQGGENENFSNSSTHHLTTCENQTPIDWYEGDYPDMSPVTIYVNFLFHPDALNWNNDANRTEQYYVDWSNEVIAEANYWLANMEQNQNVGPNGVQAPLVPDAKFRLQILTDENAPNDSGIYFQGLFNNPIHGNNNSINIRVLGENSTTLCYDDYAGDAPAIGTGAVGQQNGAVRLFNPVCSPGIPGNPNEPHQGIRSLWGRVLNHEIGHNLNLQHSASCNNVCNTVDLSPEEECNSVCPLTATCDPGVNPDDMSCPPAPDGSDVSTCTFNWGNNLMHQGNNKKAITPCQWSTVFNHIRDGNPNYFSWADNCTIIDQDLIIASNSNILWDRPKYLNRDVVVENGATLTITCTVRMATGTKIIVKRGGHLIVDGGTITSLCDDYWQGIEVWGGTLCESNSFLFGLECLYL